MKPVKVQVEKAIYVPADRPGTESPTAQVFPVWLSSNLSESRKHFVVGAHSPMLNQAQRESVASHLRLGGGAAAYDFIVDDAEGRAQVVADMSEAHAAVFDVAAAAVAVVKASCGWDESSPIMVRVNETDVPVVAWFDGSVWVAESPL